MQVRRVRDEGMSIVACITGSTTSFVSYPVTSSTWLGKHKTWGQRESRSAWC